MENKHGLLRILEKQNRETCSSWFPRHLFVHPPTSFRMSFPRVSVCRAVNFRRFTVDCRHGDGYGARGRGGSRGIPASVVQTCLHTALSRDNGSAMRVNGTSGAPDEFYACGFIRVLMKFHCFIISRMSWKFRPKGS